MKGEKLTHKTYARVIAVFLAVITLVFTVAMGINVVVMAAYGGYSQTPDYLKTEIAEKYIGGRLYSVADYYYWGNDLDDIYDNANFYYVVKDKNGNVLASNYRGEDYLCSAHDFICYDSYDEQYDITLYCKTELTQYDKLSVAFSAIDIGYSWRNASIVLGVLGLILFFALLVFLYSSAGHRSGHDEIVLNFFDKIPFDIVTAVVFIIACFAAQIADSAYWESIESYIVAVVYLIIGFVIFIFWSMTAAVRLKSCGIIKHTVIYYILRWIWKLLRKIFFALRELIHHLPLIWKTCIITAVIAFINFILAVNAYSESELLVFWFFETAILVPTVLYIAMSLRKLQKGGRAIASGELDYKVDTKYMLWDFKKHAEDLNNINSAVSTAVEERLRSERLKTELITNVSHDIKTPLTSIINYVDLIKKEEPQNEKVLEYVEVLDRQSMRLKKLIEDLVEASKASTGNLEVSMIPSDIGVMFAQAAGEYEKRFEEQNLELIIRQPEQPVYIMADGKRLWRIFDNLMNNIYKYAQPGTRVYMSLEAENRKANVIFRNISKYELNVTSDELMERFVRGDASRNTEGHGLGLSIAKSLTELQNGSLSIHIDGDLFKAVLTFDMIV